MLQIDKPLAKESPKLVAVTGDAQLAELLSEALPTDFEGGFVVLRETPERLGEVQPLDGAALVVVDVDEASDEALAGLQRFAAQGRGTPCIVVTRSLDERLARVLLQARIRDCLVKPVSPERIAAACMEALQGAAAHETGEAEILTFLPATGGVGSTTLAIHAALLLQARGGKRSPTCLVDLDLQQGVCAEYLDLEPRLELSEIEPRPERLDRQLLEVMLSRHASGLSVIAAPGRPGERVQSDPQAISRLLDLVAANFSNVVIDLPRHWFAWADSVLLGSNRLFIVAEMTVPALRQARRLASAIDERLSAGPSPRIIVNRFEQRGFGRGLSRADVEQALGGYFAGTVANRYALVREAIDQGVPISELKPKNAVCDDIARLVLPPEPAMRGRFAPLLGRLLARA